MLGKRLLISVVIVSLCGLTQLGCIAGRIQYSFSPFDGDFGNIVSGKVGDRVWAIVGFRRGSAGHGAYDATYDTITVEVDDTPATVINVHSVTPTKVDPVDSTIDLPWGVGITELRIVLLVIPKLGTGVYEMKVFHDGTEVTRIGRFLVDFYVHVTPSLFLPW